MNVSDCCGAALIVEKRADHPHVYDDEYNLEVNVWICTLCGKVVGLNSITDGLKD